MADMRIKTLMASTPEGIDLLVKSFEDKINGENPKQKVRFTQTHVTMTEKGLRFIYVLFWE